MSKTLTLTETERVVIDKDMNVWITQRQTPYYEGRRIGQVYPFMTDDLDDFGNEDMVAKDEFFTMDDPRLINARYIDQDGKKRRYP